MIVWLLGTALLSGSFQEARPDPVSKRPRPIVLRAGRILTVSHGELRDQSILITEGKIRKIAAEVEIPAGAQSLDVTSGVVVPGIVDADSDLGVEGVSNEDTGEILPDHRILDALAPEHPSFRRALRLGVTTAYVGPGNRSVIGGLGSVVKTYGSSVASMVVREDVALKAALGSSPSSGNLAPRGASSPSIFQRRPTTRMGVLWELRKAFADARRRREEGGLPDPATDTLLKALDRKLPVRVAASRATDIETALQLAEEFRLSIVLEEAQEAYRFADRLSRARIPVILRPAFRTSTLYGDESSEIRFTTFAQLAAAGVPTALLGTGLGEGDSPLTMAAFAVRCGARPEDALRAVTLTAAEILGVEARVGSIDVGKDADLVVLTGAPLEVTSRVRLVVAGGEIVTDTSGSN